LLLMRSVGCSGAAFHVRKRTFHAPMVRFMRQSPFNLQFDYLQCTIDVLFGYFMLSPVVRYSAGLFS
jgi:hypothetical protein